MKRILVVDDQPNIRLLVKLSLSSENLQVLEAESGERAIEIAQAEKLDLIIMDLIMPGGIHGLEAVKVLKSNPLTWGCPVLILSARNKKSDIEQAQRVGAIDYLSKPFHIDALRAKVEQILS